MRRLVVHCAVLAHHVFAGLYIVTTDFSDATHSYVIDAGYYRWRFATVWNFVFQIAYFSVCLLEDLMWMNQSKTLDYARKKARQLSSFCFASLVFPAACGVFFNFWTTYSYNRELIYPEAVDAKLPCWTNHSLHTVVLLAVLLEVWVAYRPYPKTSTAMLWVHSYVGCYTLVSLVTYWVRGTWVYPMLDIMTWSQRAILMLVQHMIVVVFYFMGKIINRTIWSDLERMRESSPRPLSSHQD